MSLYNIYSGRVSYENVTRWTRANKEGLGKGLVPLPARGLRVLPRNIFFLKTGANMCNLVHFVGEIRICGVQDRGVHGNGKSHGNAISMGIPHNGNSHMAYKGIGIKQRKSFINVYILN